MTDAAWLKGHHDLVVAFPDRDMSNEYAHDRGKLYRDHLDDLSEEQWFHAVATAIQHERWFPTVAALRDYATAWHPPLLREPPRSDEDLSRDRAATQRGLRMVRAVLERMK